MVADPEDGREKKWYLVTGKDLLKVSPLQEYLDRESFGPIPEVVEPMEPLPGDGSVDRMWEGNV